MITGNANFTAANGVARGKGTADDPFVIEGWSIVSTTGPAMVINDTDAFVVIKNSSLSGNYYAKSGGIVIERAMNVLMENLTVQEFGTGIIVDGSRIAPCGNISVKTCAVSACMKGLVADNATNLLIEHTLVSDLADSGIAARSCNGTNVLDDEFSDFGGTGIELANSNWSNVTDSVLTDGQGTMFWDYGCRDLPWIETTGCNDFSIADNSLNRREPTLADISGCTNVSVSNNTVTGEIHDSLNENRQPLSMTGPFGPWYLVAVFADSILLGYLLSRFTAPEGAVIPGLRPGEVDREEIVDGYPKYLKKV